MNKISQKLAFFACGVCNAIVNANGDGNAKSPPHVCSRVRWECGMALPAAVSPLAAENRSGEFGLHDDAIFYFYVFAKFFDLFHGYTSGPLRVHMWRVQHWTKIVVSKSKITCQHKITHYLQVDP